jgi:prepilin-type N-terminal cleavage/methylation domain-containing protein
VWGLAYLARRRAASHRPLSASTAIAPAAAGFSLIELLVVLIIVGVLAAISAPTWSAFANQQRLGAANDAALLVMRQAQSQSRQQKRAWSACFRDDNTSLEYAVQPGDCSAEGTWKSLTEDANNFAELDASLTNFRQNGGAYQVQFDEKGWLSTDDRSRMANAGDVGLQVAFAIRNQPAIESRSCTAIATLLGAMRVDNNYKEGGEDNCKL